MFDVTEIGKNMKNIRGNMKQEECADKLGISRAALSYYENGTRKMDIEVLYKFCKLFKVSTDYLLGLSPNPTTVEDDKTTLATTGLTVKALENIKVLCRKSKSSFASNLPSKTVTFFLESASLVKLVQCLALAEMHYAVLEPSSDIIKERIKKEFNSNGNGNTDSEKKLDEYSKLAVSALCSTGYSPIIEQELHNTVSELLESFKEALNNG